MAGRGRGRCRKGGAARKSVQVGVGNAELVSGVGETAADKTCLRTVELVDRKWFKFTPSVAAQEPGIGVGASVVVPDLSLQGMQSARRRPLHPVQASRPAILAPTSSSIPVDSKLEFKSSESAVQQVCDTIDAEVQARSVVIKAIAAAQLRSITAKLQFQLSRLPINVQNMSLDEYLKACPGIVAVSMDDGSIQLQKASPYAVLLKDSKKNLNDILSEARDIPADEAGASYYTPAFRPLETSMRQLHMRTDSVDLNNPVSVEGTGSRELSWPEYHAQLQAMGDASGFAALLATQIRQESESMKTGLMRGVTPKTIRLPKDGETLVSLNGSPLGQFGCTPGFNAGYSRRGAERRITRSSKKRSLREL